MFFFFFFVFWALPSEFCFTAIAPCLIPCFASELSDSFSFIYMSMFYYNNVFANILRLFLQILLSLNGIDDVNSRLQSKVEYVFMSQGCLVYNLYMWFSGFILISFSFVSCCHLLRRFYISLLYHIFLAVTCYPVVRRWCGILIFWILSSIYHVEVPMLKSIR